MAPQIIKTTDFKNKNDFAKGLCIIAPQSMEMEVTKPVAAGSPRETEHDIETIKSRSRKLSIADAISWSFMWGFGESYIAPFAIALKASNAAMSLLGTMPMLLGAFAQLFGASLTERLSTRKPIVVTCVTLHALCYLPLIILPYLFPSVAVPAVICIFTLMIVANSIASPPWISMVGDFVDENTRGKYFARRNQCTQLGMIITMLAASYVLSAFKQNGKIWTGFSVLFAIALISRCIAAFFMSKQYDAPFSTAKETYFSFLDFLKESRKSNFAKFTFAVSLVTGSTMIAGPFFGVYMLRDLHWSYMEFTVNTIAVLIAQALAFPWWGKISDRHGNRIIIRVTSLIMPVLPFSWLFTTNFYILLVVQVFGGIIWSGFSLAVSNFIYDSVDPQKRPRLFSYFGLVNGTFSMIGGAVIGCFLAEHLPSEYRFGSFHMVFLSSLPAVFLVSGLLRIIVGMIVSSAFKEVRPSEPISTRELLWRVTSGEPVIGQIGDFIAFVSSPFLRGSGQKKN